MAEACEGVLVLAGQIARFDVPTRVALGETAEFRVTLANHGSGMLESDLSLTLETEAGEPYAVLPAQSPSIPGGGQLDAVFAWDSTGSQPGRYRATLVWTPEGYGSRSLARVFEVYSATTAYLPLVGQSTLLAGSNSNQ